MLSGGTFTCYTGGSYLIMGPLHEVGFLNHHKRMRSVVVSASDARWFGCELAIAYLRVRKVRAIPPPGHISRRRSISYSTRLKVPMLCRLRGTLDILQNIPCPRIHTLNSSHFHQSNTRVESTSMIY